MTSLIAHITNPGRTESGTMFPSTAKVALYRQTSSLRVSWCRKVAVRVDIVVAILSVVTLTKALKALCEEGSGVMSNRNMKEFGGRGYDQSIVIYLHNK